MNIDTMTDEQIAREVAAISRWVAPATRTPQPARCLTHQMPYEQAAPFTRTDYGTVAFDNARDQHNRDFPTCPIWECPDCVVKSKTKRDAQFAYCSACERPIPDNVWWGWRKSAGLHETGPHAGRVTYWRMK